MIKLDLSNEADEDLVNDRYIVASMIDSDHIRSKKALDDLYEEEKQLMAEILRRMEFCDA